MEEPNISEFRSFLSDAMSQCQGSSAYSNDRNRPYDGQPHTDSGARGKTELKGLTFRDVGDCFIKGALLSNGPNQPELYERAMTDTWLPDDVYKLDWNNIDPIAVWQNMPVEMEKMMDIYPNVPPLTFIKD